MNGEEFIRVRATKTTQGAGVAVFSFFLYGADIARIADITKLARENGELKGFQREGIQSHVRDILQFLDSGPGLFPNSIVLALSPDVSFEAVRGKGKEGCSNLSVGGVIDIPVRPEGQRVAWIVDGQQRSLALAQAKNKKIIVPVVGFVSRDLRTQREQFILVNKVKVLSPRLINELLPDVGVVLPRDLSARKLPSALCNELAEDPQSPFFGIIRRTSDKNGDGVIIDSALNKAIQQSLRSSMGALGQFKGDGDVGDADAMYRSLIIFWTAVKLAFPEAWGKPATKSRLMHSAGIRAMGALMDQIMIRADSLSDPAAEVQASIARIAPFCRWTSGRWEELEWAWNAVQSTPQHISRLSDHLMRLDRRLARVAS